MRFFISCLLHSIAVATYFPHSIGHGTIKFDIRDAALASGSQAIGRQFTSSRVTGRSIASPSSRFSKRRASRPMNQCPWSGAPAKYENYTRFLGSTCDDPKRGSKKFEIFCNRILPKEKQPDEDYKDTMSGVGSCKEHEMCIDSPKRAAPGWAEGLGHTFTAWCVHSNAFVVIANATLSNFRRYTISSNGIVTQSGNITQGGNLAQSGNLTPNGSFTHIGNFTSYGKEIQLILTRQGNEDISVQAKEMSIVPRDVNDQIIGRSASCSDCSTLSYHESPKSTHNYDFNVTMPTADDTAVVRGWVFDT